MTRMLGKRSFRRAAKTNTRAACAPRILLQRNWLLRFFDELFKARIATQRIPERQQFQLTITETAWTADDAGKLFAGEIFVTNPCSDHRQILDHVRAIHCIFFHGKKLNRAPAFAQRFLFPAQPGVDQTKHAQRRAVIWLSLDDFLLCRACSSKSRPRSLVVFRHTSNDAFCKWTIETNILASKTDGLLAKRDQSIFCSSGVAFAQCAYKPKFSDTRHRGRICGSN